MLSSQIGPLSRPLSRRTLPTIRVDSCIRCRSFYSDLRASKWSHKSRDAAWYGDLLLAPRFLLARNEQREGGWGYEVLWVMCADRLKGKRGVSSPVVGAWADGDSSVSAPAGLEWLWRWFLSAGSLHRPAEVHWMTAPGRTASEMLGHSHSHTRLYFWGRGEGGISRFVSLQSLRVNFVSFLCFSSIEKERRVYFRENWAGKKAYIEVSHSWGDGEEQNKDRRKDQARKHFLWTFSLIL